MYVTVTVQLDIAMIFRWDGEKHFTVSTSMKCIIIYYASPDLHFCLMSDIKIMSRHLHSNLAMLYKT